VDEAVRGRVVALFMTIFGGVFPLGALAAGAIADRVGAPVTTIAGGVIVLAWGIGLAIRSRSAIAVDGTPPPPEKRRDGAQAGRGPHVTSEASTRVGRRQRP
jgi:hypothetical protein